MANIYSWKSSSRITDLCDKLHGTQNLSLWSEGMRRLFFFSLNIKHKAEKKEERPFPSQFPRARDRQDVNSKKQFTSGLIRKVDRRERGTRKIGTGKINMLYTHGNRGRRVGCVYNERKKNYKYLCEIKITYIPEQMIL